MLKSLKIIGGKGGIALLITLSVTTILVTAALEYNRRARFAVMATASMRDRLTLTQAAAAGVHAAMALLVKDKAESNVDSLQEDWANPEKIEEILREIPFEDGKLTLVISDELGRIQVNALVDFPNSNQFKESQVILWDRFLRHIGDEEEMQDDSDPVAIINSIKDWLDSGDDDATTGLSGAESSYYEDLDPPYAARNNPIPDVNELLLIKGITPRLYYGTAAKAGIAQSVTVHGMTAGAGTSFTWPGRININTADLPVLVALLPSESGDLAQLLYDYRQEVAVEDDLHDFSNPQWYKNVPGFQDVSIDPTLITTASDVFRIESVAGLDRIQSRITAVIQRVQNEGSGKWTCKILSWQTN
jgi:general secretion pathway protein K